MVYINQIHPYILQTFSEHPSWAKDSLWDSGLEGSQEKKSQILFENNTEFMKMPASIIMILSERMSLFYAWPPPL